MIYYEFSLHLFINLFIYFKKKLSWSNIFLVQLILSG